MGNLIVIGNGFDKAHDLNTTFDDFIGSSPVYAEKYSAFKNQNNLWREVEEKFKEIIVNKLLEIGSEVNVEEIVENIVDQYGTDEAGQVQYWGYRSEAFSEEINQISKIVLLLNSFESDFHYYLKTHYNDLSVLSNFHSMNKVKKYFDTATRCISFNYTNVIELLYGFNNVEHIHGNINDNILIGCDTFERINKSSIIANYPSSRATGRHKDVLLERMKYYEYDMNHNLIEREGIKRFFNDVVSKNQYNEEELYKWLKMKSKNCLDYRQKIIEDLSKEEYDEVHIIGHSLGKADWDIFNVIKAKKVICYYHEEDENDYVSKKLYIEKNNWKFLLKY